MKQEASKPLIVMTPKSLLRLPQATSPLDHFTTGGFLPVIGDAAQGANVKRVILCSGKVYYDLQAAAAQAKRDDVAILRLEQFYPFPQQALLEWLAAFPQANEILWVQEEPQNMGGWNFVRPRLEALMSGRQELRYVGRAASASPATGSYTIHQLEQQQIVKEALGE